MKRIINSFIAVVMVLGCSVVHASPSGALWRSVSIFGANKDHYYTLVTQRDFPGSYFSYRDRIFIEKYITKLNRKVFSVVISDIQHTNVDIEKHKWKTEVKASQAFDLAGYVEKEKIVPLYPGSLDPGFRVVYMKDGLHLERKGKSVLLRPLGKSRLALGELGISGIYDKAGFILLKVSQGEGYPVSDVSYLEMVLPIPKSVWNRAKKQLTDKR